MNDGRQRLARLSALQQMRLFFVEELDVERFVAHGEIEAPVARLPYDPKFLEAWQRGFAS